MSGLMDMLGTPVLQIRATLPQLLQQTQRLRSNSQIAMSNDVRKGASAQAVNDDDEPDDWCVAMLFL